MARHPVKGPREPLCEWENVMLHRSNSNIVAVSIILSCLTAIAHAQVSVLGSCDRADELFPEFSCFWHEGWSPPDESYDKEVQNRADEQTPGGSIHAFVLNEQSAPLRIEDVLIEGMSMKESLVFSDQRKTRKPASIYFGNLAKPAIDKLLSIGEPVWWRVDPNPIKPGATAEVTVRLRSRPSFEKLRIGLKCQGGTETLDIDINRNQPRVAGVFFSPNRDRAYLYFRYPGKKNPPLARILMDGVDLTSRAQIAHDPALATTPVILELQDPPDTGSFHVYQGVYQNGETALAGVRTWADEFAYGMWGGWPGDAKQAGIGRKYVTDLVEHNINVQMPQVGSQALQTFFKSDAGVRFCKSRGFRKVINQPGKWGERDPYLFFIHDEPDCGDYRMKGLAMDKKVGALAQWTVQRSQELREADPTKLQLLNLDMTVKPHNWYTYGQVPDVMAADPYYQARIRQAYYGHPERLVNYVQAGYIWAVSRVCQSACEPRPLHIILYSSSHVDNENGRRFRFPTPEEKRIEAYYAVAGGAKGLSYWWFTPSKRKKGSYAYGVGAASTDGNEEAIALFTEIGLLGAEFRTAGPLITRSCVADLAMDVKGAMFVRGLLVDTETVLLIAVNEQYANDREGTVYRPIDGGAMVKLEPPKWLDVSDVFEITADGVQNVDYEVTTGGRLELNLDRVDLTRFIVITADKKLRGELGKLYNREFAANVVKLKSRHDGSRSRSGAAK